MWTDEHTKRLIRGEYKSFSSSCIHVREIPEEEFVLKLIYAQ
jgi:hypothetical protein